MQRWPCPAPCSLSPVSRSLSGGALALFGAVPASAGVVYVDRNATGALHDGSSWCEAFLELSEALDVTPSGSTVWLADGTYLPNAMGLEDPRDASFGLQGVTVIGGFAGCGAADPDERAPQTYETILSGDLAGNDPSGFTDDNAYHVAVVSGPNAAVLSGVTLRGGNADGREGGGIYSLGGTFRLENCVLRENLGWRGGGIYLESGSAELVHCRIAQNISVGEGGAIFAATSGLSLDNCLVFANGAGSDGGAVFVDLCTVPITNTTFVGNVSDARGGAIYMYVGTFLDLDNSILWGNSDANGSGEDSQVWANPSNDLVVDSSCIEGWSGAFGGTGNFGLDPEFLDPNGGDLHVGAQSPCIDAGDDGAVRADVDLDGNPRTVGSSVDMGCYEFQDTSGLPDIGAPPVGDGGIGGGPNDGGTSSRLDAALSLRGDPGGGLILRIRPPETGPWTVDAWTAEGRRIGSIARGVAESSADADLRTEYVEVALEEWAGVVPSGICFLALRQGGRTVGSTKLVTVR
ncbi:MAG: right-handed parallel beta-helix repeat-containing protein [Candidatus Eisenbacteria bacterium]